VVSRSDYEAWLAKAKADQGDQAPLKVPVDDEGDTAGATTGSGS
jgi:hypothetical protein